MHRILVEYGWIVAYPLAVLWASFTFLRRILLGSSGYNAQVPVICVGNIHSGGSSKTPVVIEIVKHFSARQPVVLSRGYGRTNTCLEWEVDNTTSNGPARFGDEPWLISHETSVPVLVGSNRATLVKKAVEKKMGSLFVMDDGFQNFTLQKNINIICINTGKSLQDANCIPLGELRETFFSLGSAGSVLLIQGEDALSHSEWQEYLQNHWPLLPYFEAKAVFEGPGQLGSDRWIAFCGTASPDRFSAALQRLRCDHKAFYFKDHHKYQPKDVEHLMMERKKEEAAGFVTTLKDYYKAVELFRKYNENIHTLKMKVEIEDRFWSFLEKQLE